MTRVRSVIQPTHAGSELPLAERERGFETERLREREVVRERLQLTGFSVSNGRASLAPGNPTEPVPLSARCSCEKRHSFFEYSLCVSRACLGKMIVLMHKWLKKRRFSHRVSNNPDAAPRLGALECQRPALCQVVRCGSRWDRPVRCPAPFVPRGIGFTHRTHHVVADAWLCRDDVSTIMRNGPVFPPCRLLSRAYLGKSSHVSQTNEKETCFK
jgi:hypothetical protein